MSKLIAFVGWQKSGKTTAAKILQNRHGWIRTRFAGPLRNMLRAIGLNEYWLDGDGKNKPCPLLLGKTPVQAMQTLGTEWGRDCIHPDLWAGLWEHQALDVLEHEGKCVVDDLRFPNEAEKVLDLDGTIIRIIRPGIDQGSTHESESFTAGLVAHHEVLNDGTEQQLEARLLEIIECL